MRKHLIAWASVGLMLGLFVFIGCKKNQSSGYYARNSNVQLVPVDSALKVAVNFNPSVFFHADNPNNHSPVKSSLNGNNAIKNYVVIKDHDSVPALYAINFTNNNGFLFVSADYRISPIVAFFENGEFVIEKAPGGFLQWKNKTMEDIDIVRKGLYDNSKVAQLSWKQYLKENDVNSKFGVAPNALRPMGQLPPDTDPCSTPDYTNTTTVTVGPLLPVTWGQVCTYNNNCPDLSCSLGCGNGRALTGCVATASAQIIRYWQAANGHNYNYASMPSGSGNSEVQRLMRDVGDAVLMNYGCGASSANHGLVPNALKQSFGFTSASLAGYNSQILINNISNNWPVFLKGCDVDCHAWVCDGYDQTNYTYCDNGTQYIATYYYFHMNWGWHETWGGSDYNGWFSSNNWNISGLNRNFQYAQDIIYNMHP